MLLHFLGAAAGGGYPQWNCACSGCRAARSDPGRASLHASVAVSGTGERWYLINATPDVHHQIAATPELHPGPGVRETPLAGVLLTDAEFDHTLGLLILREGSSLRVLGTATVLATLTDDFPVRSLLRDYAQISWETVEPGTPVRLDEALTITAIAVGRKQPRYAGSTRPGDGAVVAYRLEDTRTGKIAVYAPAVSRWEGALAQTVADADCVVVDGTFWTDDEMPRSGTGSRLGHQMGHQPMSGPNGTAVRLAALPAKHKIYTHINNTNPALDPRSAAHRELTELGIVIGRAGLKVEL